MTIEIIIVIIVAAVIGAVAGSIIALEYDKSRRIHYRRELTARSNEAAECITAGIHRGFKYELQAFIDFTENRVTVEDKQLFEKLADDFLKERMKDNRVEVFNYHNVHNEL